MQERSEPCSAMLTDHRRRLGQAKPRRPPKVLYPSLKIALPPRAGPGRLERRGRLCLAHPLATGSLFHKPLTLVFVHI